MILCITGGTGTLGHALVNRLAGDYDKIIIVSRDELKQHEMEQTVPDNVRFFIGDVRDRERLCQLLKGVDHVVHAAALKQVPRCEYNPTEAIKTNVDGSMNVINACLAANVKRCVFVSTDKAVNPIKLYGATKLCAEKMFMAANQYENTSFGVVRYGNVIASRGSLVEMVEKCRLKNCCIPITHMNMTRFWMTKEQAVILIEEALVSLITERPMIYKAKCQKIVDFVRDIWPDSVLEQIGIRPGEKMHELLAAQDEEVWAITGDGWEAMKGPISSSDTEK